MELGKGGGDMVRCIGKGMGEGGGGKGWRRWRWRMTG